MHNVLFICRAFPPARSSGVPRPIKFVKYLGKFGWKPQVVTISDSGFCGNIRDDSFIDEIPPVVEVHRVFSMEPFFLKALILTKTKHNSVLKIPGMALWKLYAMLYYRLVVFDSCLGWIPFGYKKAASLIKQGAIDCLFICGQPPSSLVMGYMLKKRFNCPMVVDYDDPWTTSSFYYPRAGIKGRISRYMEHKILISANRIVLCKQSIRNDMLSQFKDLDENKIVYIPNGYDPDDFENVPIPKSDKFRMVYTGKIGGKSFCYSPNSFFLALENLISEKTISGQDMEVVMAGMVPLECEKMIHELSLGAIVRFSGYLNHRECIELLQNSDALLLLMESALGPETSAKFAGSLPSKIFEYLYAAKPILAIIPEGPEKELLKEAGHDFFARPNDPESIKQAILSLFKQYRSKNQAFPPHWDFIRTFDRKVQTEKLAKHLSEVSGSF
jgi:Glycosyltransferase